MYDTPYCFIPLLHPSGCAVSAPCPIGIDVELLSRIPSQLLRLAKRRLSLQEYEALESAFMHNLGAPVLTPPWHILISSPCCCYQGLGLL